VLVGSWGVGREGGEALRYRLRSWRRGCCGGGSRSGRLLMLGGCLGGLGRTFFYWWRGWGLVDDGLVGEERWALG